MKKYFFFLLLFSLGVNADVQSSSYKPAQITTDSLRHTYTYDNEGRLTIYFKEAKTPQGTYNNIERDSYTYDNNGNNITLIKEFYLYNAWHNGLKRTNTYDNSNHLLAVLYESWNGSLGWDRTDSLSNIYDNSGRISEYIYQGKLGPNLPWVNNGRGTRTYTGSSNKISQEILYVWQNDVWTPVNRLSYTYDSSENMLSCLIEMYINNSWVNLYLDTFTYNNSGNELTGQHSYWGTNSWLNDRRHTYTYYSNGCRSLEFFELFTNGAWRDLSKHIYVYDSFKNPIHGEAFYWINNAWVSLPDILNVLYEDSETPFVNGRFDEAYVYGRFYDAEYQLFTTVENDKIPADEFRLGQNYPNPFNPTTTIDYSVPAGGYIKLTVYNNLGAEVAELVNEYKPAGSYSIDFNGKDLSSGIYFYRLESNSYSVTRKLILLK